MSRRGRASSYSCLHHDSVFMKRPKNTKLTWCLILAASGEVLMRHSDRDALLAFKVRNKFIGTTIEQRPYA